ncbi:MAG: TonB-dependent receptor plug domain-containing protein, partial [Pseudomonadota bacterium]
MKHDQTAACLINNTRDLFCSSALAVLLMSSAPFAKAQTDSLPQSDDETARLATVTVTGTKREQTLQETPVAISVVGAEEIERAEILDFQDLQTLVPSLTIRQQQSSASTSFFIRGFGNGANAIG